MLNQGKGIRKRQCGGVLEEQQKKIEGDVSNLSTR